MVGVDEEVRRRCEGKRKAARGLGEIDGEADGRVVEDAAVDVVALAQLARAGRLDCLAGERGDALTDFGAFADAVSHYFFLGAPERAVAELARAESERDGPGGERRLGDLERADT